MFDENECFKPLYINEFFAKIQKFVHRKFGIGLCFWRGRWNIPFNPLPYPGEYVVAMGRPIRYEDYKKYALEGQEGEDKAVELLMIAYQNEIKRLFQELKDDTGRRQDVELEIHVLQTRSTRKATSGGADEDNNKKTD
jgi:hypothetical protein